MSNQKIVKRYDKDLGLYLDMIQELNEHKKYLQLNLSKNNHSKEYMVKEKLRIKKKFNNLRKRLETRLNIHTIDSIINQKRNRNRKGYF